MKNGRFTKKHGLSGTRIHRIWNGMIYRCHNERSHSYVWYGARGIKVCDRWRYSIHNFIADMGEPPPNKTLDRIDNDGDYCPENCRWATHREQMLNTSKNHHITFAGKTMTLGEWAAHIGMSRNTLTSRICQYHWSAERSLTTPVRIQ